MFLRSISPINGTCGRSKSNLAVHQRLCEDCVNFPGLDEDSREHEVRAKDSVELEEDAGVLIERAVEEQDPGDLTHKGASEKEGEIM